MSTSARSQTRIEKIVQTAERLSNEYLSDRGGWNNLVRPIIDLQLLYESVIYPECEFDLVMNLDLGYLGTEKILGKTITSEGKILIDRSIVPPNKDPRLPFTQCHEFGHAINHRDGAHHHRCTSESVGDERRPNSTELEANVFAANLLMPAVAMKHLFRECYKPSKPIRYLSPGKYGFDAFGAWHEYKVSSYTEFCRLLALPLTFYFGNVSKQSMAYRIHCLGLVRNESKETFGDEPNSIGHIISRIMTRV